MWFIREGGPNKEGFCVRFEVFWIMRPCSPVHSDSPNNATIIFELSVGNAM